MNHLIQFARAVVEQVKQQIMQQQNVIADQVQQTIQGFVNQIMGGIWIGKDADAFADEVANRVMSEIAQILGAVAGIHTSVTNATDALDQGDQQAQQIVESLADTLGNVY